jgi:predicted GNAT superfamily acetyltransferase
MVSPDIDKVYDQSFPFVIMNISVMVAALVLGFSPNSQISLQECVWFRSRSYHRFTDVLIIADSSPGSSPLFHFSSSLWSVRN